MIEPSSVVAGAGLDGFWIHVDADVLNDDEMPAVDYRNPGGLTWDQRSGRRSTPIRPCPHGRGPPKFAAADAIKSADETTAQSIRKWFQVVQLPE